MSNIVQKTQDNPSWITIDKASSIMNQSVKTLKEHCRLGKLTFKIEKKGKKSNYFVAFSSLPDYAQNKITGETDYDKKYSEAPEWAKTQADKYDRLLKLCAKKNGTELKDFIQEWNKKNPEIETSYSSVIKMRRRYFRYGLYGLLSKHGTNQSTVKPEYYEYFKQLYLIEGGPSARSCWQSTLGYAKRIDNIFEYEFPSHVSFMRKLNHEIPAQSIYLARKGKSAWNRKYGGYLERDYSIIACGETWVSDHAQIDVACLSPDGNIVFPWVTAWRDYKSGKWLGWIIQCGHPNSDHIFQAFYSAATVYGLPKDVIIDNGKDYRCKDFAGGRKSANKTKINTDENKTTAMLDELKVEVHFALPYNAQTKPIERDFLKIKGLLSKHCIGYRGGNIVERPEKLAEEIRKGKIIIFDRFKTVFDDFIINVLNKKPVQGKILNGLAPDDLFEKECTNIITPSKEALKLFCMRTSKVFTIGRNGIKDNELGITYWADWMASKTKLKVYLRREPDNFKEAWAFKADNNEYVGNVTAVRAVAALHADKISKEEFKEAMAIKKRNFKIAKSYIEQNQEITIEEKCANYKAAFASVERQTKAKVSTIANTNMDKAVRKHKEMQAFGKEDLSMFLDDASIVKDEPLYMFETDKILDDELKGVVNGY